MSDIQKSLTNKDNWLRGFFMIMMAVFYKITGIIICIIAIFQFVLTIFGKNLNGNLKNFSSSLVSYVYKLLLFVTYLSDEKPYPFSKWPDGHVIKNNKEKQDPKPKRETTSTKQVKKIDGQN
ncbi:MAG: hypothetical protein DRQ51_05835 [Gammaproteobacteria bacterium]|nr:MAG: hypothetical protein DRQ51_05835 [Gammaproteobacteria bacterium]